MIMVICLHFMNIVIVRMEIINNTDSFLGESFVISIQCINVR